MKVVTSLAFLIILVALACISVLYSRRRGRERSESFQEIGKRLGLLISPKASYGTFSAKLKGSDLFKRATRNFRLFKIDRLMRGNIDSFEVSLFDHSYAKGDFEVVFVGDGPSSGVVITETAVLFHSNELSLPGFLLCPEKIHHKLGILRRPDIDFSQVPVFSLEYLLQGDEKQIRKLFNNNILSYFDSNPGWSVEGLGTRLLFYEKNTK